MKTQKKHKNAGEAGTLTKSRHYFIWFQGWNFPLSYIEACSLPGKRCLQADVSSNVSQSCRKHRPATAATTASKSKLYNRRSRDCAGRLPWDSVQILLPTLIERSWGYLGRSPWMWRICGLCWYCNLFAHIRISWISFLSWFVLPPSTFDVLQLRVCFSPSHSFIHSTQTCYTVQSVYCQNPLGRMLSMMFRPGNLRMLHSKKKSTMISSIGISCLEAIYKRRRSQETHTVLPGGRS